MTRGVLPQSRMPTRWAQGAGEVPPADVGIGDVIGARWSLAGDRTGWEREQNDNQVRNSILEALQQDDPQWYGRWMESRKVGPFYEAGGIDSAWDALEERRRSKPAFLPSLPADRTAFDSWVTQRQVTRRRGDQRIANASSGVAQGLAGFGAEAAGSIFKDPFNIGATVATGGVGVAGGIIRQSITQFAVNAGIEAAEQPTIVAPEMDRLGEPVTIESAAWDIGMAGFGGAGFHLAGVGAKAALPHVVKGAAKAIDGGRGAMERALAASWDRLPQAVRSRWASAAEIPDSALPDIAEQLIGTGNMSLDEQAAVTILRREADIDAGNPFVPNGAGAARHAESMGQALQRIFDEVPGAATPTSRPALRASTAPIALNSGDVGQALKNRIGTAESGGSNVARNPNSTALGKYQFTRGTWLGYYKRRFGSQGMTDDAIAALRTDPGLQDRLMDDLVADNKAMLRQVGAAETSGNLYLTHFLGQRGARRVLEADGNAPVAGLVGADAVRANKSILEGKTAGEVIAWAHRKMGELPAAPVGARTVLARGEGAVDPSGAAARIQAELDRADAELRAVRAEQDAARAAEDGEIVPDVPHGPRDWDDAEPVSVADLVPARADDPAMVEQPYQQQQARQEVLALIEPMRRIVRDGKQSLRDVEAIAARLEKPVADVRDALAQLVVRGELRQRRDGGYSRPPVNRRPVDALRFVAQNGGLSPRGVRGDASGHDLGTVFQGKNGRPQMFPGGPIVRNAGHTLDDMGEKLWEAGYFGPPETVARPTEDDVLTLLEDSFRSGRKVYSMEDASEVAEREMREAAILADEAMMREADDHARAMGHDLSPDELAAWLDVQRETGLDPDEALTEYFNRQLDDSVWDALADHDREAYDQFLSDLDNARAARGDGGDDRGGRSGVGRDAPEGPPSGPDWANDPYEGWEPARLEGWEEPNGPAAEAQADSLLHDVQIAVEAETVYFRTGKGSTYTAAPDGRTARDKMARPEHPGEEGAQPLSQATFYVERSALDPLSLFQTQGGHPMAVAIDKGHAALRYSAGPDAGKIIKGTVVPIHSKPVVGLYPVEIWKDGSRVHFGNEIVEVSSKPIDKNASPDLFGGATRDEARQALEQKAEGGKSNGVDQKPAGSDGGLFDTGARDQMGFQLDEEGGAITPVDLLRQLDEEDEAIRKMDACMVPKKPKPEGEA